MEDNIIMVLLCVGVCIIARNSDGVAIVNPVSS